MIDLEEMMNKRWLYICVYIMHLLVCVLGWILTIMSIAR